MNLALYFTLLRVILIPLFPVFYLEYEKLHIPLVFLPYILFSILFICEFTDILDGFLARKRNQVTELGKILDPMADAITRILVLFTFTQGWVSLPLLLVSVFLYREFFISTLRTVCALKGFALAARTSGKIKAFFLSAVNFFVVILFLFFTLGILSLETLQKTALIVVSFAAFYSVMSAVDYIWANCSYIKRALSLKKT